MNINALTQPSKYILLAEDNPADVQLVREALKDRAINCDLQVVPDGEQAVRLIEQLDVNPGLRCPSLFLVDLHLPRLDGEEILRCLRSSERCGQTAVVIMTSSDAPGEIESAVRNAAVHYFRKPSNLEEFLKLGDVVRSILGPNG